MKTHQLPLTLMVLAGLIAAGCENESGNGARAPAKGGVSLPDAKVPSDTAATFQVDKHSEPEVEPTAAESKPAPPQPDPAFPALPEGAKRAELRPGCGVYLDNLGGGKRRVLFRASVCQREVLLELLLTKKRQKEHEAILAADVDARHLHAALLATGAKPGSVVKYVEKNGQYEIIPPRGQKIKVSILYEDKGKPVTVPAQKWVRNLTTKKELDLDWVFTGSLFIPDTEDNSKPPLYAANGGDVICLSNFEGAFLDLPINSSKENADRMFEPFTERIPPLDTKVVVILEPIADKK